MYISCIYHLRDLKCTEYQMIVQKDDDKLN